MFGISLGELSLIAIVALVVIGPEKLPQVARTIGMLAGKSQRIINELKSEWVSQSGLEDVVNETRDTFNKISNDIQSSESEKTADDEEAIPTPPPPDTPRRGFHRGSSPTVSATNSEDVPAAKSTPHVEAKQVDFLNEDSNQPS